MADYAFLVRPALNAVYASASVQLSQAELTVLDAAVGGGFSGVAEAMRGGVPYVVFSADRLGDRTIRFLSNLSSIYALFEVQADVLRPVELQPLDCFADDLITIQKYRGKTNERFTKLLLNVTILSTNDPGVMLDRKLHVLDPLCGRGTSLNQALVYGFDVAGIEIDRAECEAYARFLATYLKRGRVKHTIRRSTIRQDRRIVGERVEVELGVTKERYTAGDLNRVVVINGETSSARQFFRPSTFDVIVADLPYGVRHGSRAAEGRLSRRPLDLLAEALPVWTEVLRPGGAIGLAWNTRVAARDKVVQAIADHELDVLSTDPYLAFRHVVDQSITRDIIVARKR